MLHTITKRSEFCTNVFFPIELIYTNTILKKSLRNKRTTEPYLIYGDQIGETKNK